MENDERKRTIDNQNIDWLLQDLVDMANTFGIYFSITLTIKGFLISGILISGRRYFEYFAETFSSAVPKEYPEISETIKKKFLDIAEVYPNFTEESLEVLKEEDKPENIRFFHLKDAKILFPGQSWIPSKEGIYWRGRLDSVDGFKLGTISTE